MDLAIYGDAGKQGETEANDQGIEY